MRDSFESILATISSILKEFGLAGSLTGTLWPLFFLYYFCFVYVLSVYGGVGRLR